jgi:hypothetical protein
MGIETQNNHTKNNFDIEEENSEVEGEVDLEVELISTLDELSIKGRINHQDNNCHNMKKHKR